MEKKALLGRTIRASFGIMLTGVGIYFMIQANIGVDPWNVFNLGLSKTLGILYGNTAIIIGVAIILIDILMREKIGLGTLLDVLICGKTVDFLNWLNIVPQFHNVWLGILSTFIGIFIMCFAQCLYMREALGCGPRDALQMGIGRRLPNIDVSWVLGGILLVVLAIGWLLGGPVGLGTVIAPVGIAVVQKFVFKLAHFDPKSVTHIDIIEAFKIFFAKSDQ